MISMLNNGEYEKAKDFVLQHHESGALDEQAIVMFVNGYSVIDESLDHELVQALSSISTDDLRTNLRIGFMRELIKREESE